MCVLNKTVTSQGSLFLGSKLERAVSVFTIPPGYRASHATKEKYSFFAMKPQTSNLVVLLLFCWYNQ
jgi:hypothetical protein